MIISKGPSGAMQIGQSMTKKTIKKKAKTKKKADTPVSMPTSVVAYQTLLLEKDELLIYRDELGEHHILLKEEYNPQKDYRILFLSYEDL